MSGTFDTLMAARELEAAGMERKQAEAVRPSNSRRAGRARDERRPVRAPGASHGHALPRPVDTGRRDHRCDRRAGGNRCRARVSLERAVTLRNVRIDITTLKWMAGVNLALSLATLGAVLAMAVQP